MRTRASRLGSTGVNAPARRFTSTGYLPANPTTAVVATDADITKFTGVVSAIMNGGSITFDVPASSYLVRLVSSTVVEVQLQIFDGTNTKCVKVRLQQAGQNIAGSVMYARYKSGNTLGQDADSGWTSQLIATSDASSGYGCKEIRIGVRG